MLFDFFFTCYINVIVRSDYTIFSSFFLFITAKKREKGNYVPCKTADD